MEEECPECLGHQFESHERETENFTFTDYFCKSCGRLFKSLIHYNDD